MSGVKPLQSIAMGLLVVALTARIGGVDVLLDPVGWLLVVNGTSRLQPHLAHRGSCVALAFLALLVSVPLAVPAVVDALGHADDSLLWAANLPQVGFTAVLCAALARAAADAGDRGASSWLRTGWTLTVAVGVLPILVYAAEPDLLVPLLLLAVVAVLLVIVLLFRYSGRAWAPARAADEDAPLS